MLGMPKRKAKKVLASYCFASVLTGYWWTLQWATISASLIRAKCQNTQVSQVSSVVPYTFSNSSILKEEIKRIALFV